MIHSRKGREELVERFFEGTGASYDRVVRITTFGRDAYWKTRLLAHVPENATAILDLACGTGIVSMRIHEAHPNARLVGVDMTDEYLAVARRKFEDIAADVTFLHSNAETMELTGEFDAVVSSYIPKYADPEILLDRLEGHLKPGAVVALHDFDHPRGLVPKMVWNTHMWALRTLGRSLFKEWRVVFDDNLAQLIKGSKWVSRYAASFAKRGFEDIRRERLTYRAASIVSARMP